MLRGCCYCHGTSFFRISGNVCFRMIYAPERSVYECTVRIYNRYTRTIISAHGNKQQPLYTEYTSTEACERTIGKTYVLYCKFSAHFMIHTRYTQETNHREFNKFPPFLPWICLNCSFKLFVIRFISFIVILCQLLSYLRRLVSHLSSVSPFVWMTRLLCFQTRSQDRKYWTLCHVCHAQIDKSNGNVVGMTIV